MEAAAFEVVLAQRRTSPEQHCTQNIVVHIFI